MSFAPSAPPGTFAPGTRIQVGKHRVQVQKYLSEGGFAHVYLVQLPQALDGTDLAVLKRVAVPDKDTLRGMRTEVETMKRLRGHKAIVTYIDSHASELRNGRGYEVFLLMEYCNGGGLIDFMNTRLQHRLTEPEILHIFADVAEGVACMHYLRPPLLHRDIKVENVLITTPPGGRRRFKVCDFGSAAVPRAAPSTAAECRQIEEDIQCHTTLQYRSPEMVDVYRRLPIDEKSDIWALGVFLYKLCYYTTPFENQGQLAILNATVAFPSQPYFSERLRALISSMLREHPQNRPNIYQVLQQTCIMAGRTVPIKDIYASPTSLSSSTPPQKQQQQQQPSPSLSTTSSRSSQPVGAVFVSPSPDAGKPVIPTIVPQFRGRKPPPSASSTSSSSASSSYVSTKAGLPGPSKSPPRLSSARASSHQSSRQTLADGTSIAMVETSIPAAKADVEDAFASLDRKSTRSSPSKHTASGKTLLPTPASNVPSNDFDDSFPSLDVEDVQNRFPDLDEFITRHQMGEYDFRSPNSVSTAASGNAVSHGSGPIRPKSNAAAIGLPGHGSGSVIPGVVNQKMDTQRNTSQGMGGKSVSQGNVSKAQAIIESTPELQQIQKEQQRKESNPGSRPSMVSIGTMTDVSPPSYPQEPSATASSSSFSSSFSPGTVTASVPRYSPPLDRKPSSSSTTSASKFLGVHHRLSFSSRPSLESNRPSTSSVPEDVRRLSMGDQEARSSIGDGDRGPLFYEEAGYESDDVSKSGHARKGSKDKSHFHRRKLSEQYNKIAGKVSGALKKLETPGHGRGESASQTPLSSDAYLSTMATKSDAGSSAEGLVPHGIVSERISHALDVPKSKTLPKKPSIYGHLSKASIGHISRASSSTSLGTGSSDRLRDSRSPSPVKPLFDHYGALSPVAGSEGTYEDERDPLDDDGLDEAAIPPEIRREMERKQLEDEERRVAAAQAEYRRKLAERDEGSGRGSAVEKKKPMVAVKPFPVSATGPKPGSKPSGAGTVTSGRSLPPGTAVGASRPIGGHASLSGQTSVGGQTGPSSVRPSSQGDAASSPVSSSIRDRAKHLLMESERSAKQIRRTAQDYGPYCDAATAASRVEEDASDDGMAKNGASGHVSTTGHIGPGSGSGSASGSVGSRVSGVAGSVANARDVPASGMAASGVAASGVAPSSSRTDRSSTMAPSLGVQNTATRPSAPPKPAHLVSPSDVKGKAPQASRGPLGPAERTAVGRHAHGPGQAGSAGPSSPSKRVGETGASSHSGTVMMAPDVAGQPVLEMTEAEHAAYLEDFTRRFPSLEMVETEIPVSPEK